MFRMWTCGLLQTLLSIAVLPSPVCVLGSVVRKSITYNFLLPSTWQEARESCRTTSKGLALLTRQSDLDSLLPYIYLSWIGLHNTGNDWEWSDGTNYRFERRDWRSGDSAGAGDCAVANSTESSKYQAQPCDNRLFFYCYDQDSAITFVMWATTWENAQVYCRTNHIDLVTLEKGLKVKDLADDDLFYVWTGLHRAGPGADWQWSLGQSGYQHWEEGKPTGDGDCVGISNTEDKMTNLNCSSAWPFYCYSDNLVLVQESKTWEEALDHCRNMDSTDSSFGQLNDLISISDEMDQLTVWSRINEATTDEVWTGLRYLAHRWFWSDGTAVPYQDLPHCPDLGQYCGTLVRDNSTIQWKIRDCTEKRNFLCYRKY